MNIVYALFLTVKYINDWYENEEYAFLKYIPKEEKIIREISINIPF